jgi:hypothetical protein
MVLLLVKFFFLFVYYESMKRNLKIKPIYECRCNGRLQTKKFTRLSHTGLVVELEHLKIKTRLTNEKFESVKGECETYLSVSLPTNPHPVVSLRVLSYLLTRL